MKRVITGALWTVMLGVMWYFQGTVMRVILSAMIDVYKSQGSNPCPKTQEYDVLRAQSVL